ncbi:hypothetical protein ALC62_09308 [Cyphomyrmex costatus]|uniref:Uncharacterized protein n=1 Tax=Cyphomyrmex costatus TaxID=456900 RepID=A0A151IFL6_9HYME|nr:hypothetical protein ALC62_09308 [Cyphomyrmex costatus]
MKLAQEISQKFCKERTYLQVENRYKTILRRKKCAIDNNSQSGSSRQNVPFEEELHKIASTDDSIQPEVVRTAKGVKRLKNSERVSVKINSSTQETKKKAVSITEKLEELHEKIEKARKKRHQDKMALIRELWHYIYIYIYIYIADIIYPLFDSGLDYTGRNLLTYIVICKN